jgi:hypothetical protein
MFKEQYFSESLKEMFPIKYITKYDYVDIDVERYFPECPYDLGKQVYKIAFIKRDE